MKHYIALDVSMKETAICIVNEQMSEKTLRTKAYLVRRCSRRSIQTSIDKARLLNATRMEEVLDKEKIKALYLEGQEISGISTIIYITVSIPNNPKPI